MSSRLCLQARTWSGCSAAHCSAMHGHAAVLRALLAAGASADAVAPAAVSARTLPRGVAPPPCAQNMLPQQGSDRRQNTLIKAPAPV